MKCSIVSDTARVRELASLLENFVVLFVEREGKLVGSVTNGDFRRGISSGTRLDDPVSTLMNPNPISVASDDNYETRLARAKQLPAGFRYLPELDRLGRILRIVSDNGLISLPNSAVIMAGGLGSRLRTLTSNTPKPMLHIGGRPVLQLILEQLRRAGISRFYISVHYKADVIKEYFGDGSSFDVRIDYLEEPEQLGTAGCLSLLGAPPAVPFFVLNGDVITEINPHSIISHHNAVASTATVCLHRFDQQIPYGVVSEENGRVKSIDEKPVATYNINAGVYLMEPEVLSWIKPRTRYDMPALLLECQRRHKNVGAFHLPGPWIDIGSIEDFHRAAHEYREFLQSQ